MIDKHIQRYFTDENDLRVQKWQQLSNECKKEILANKEESKEIKGIIKEFQKNLPEIEYEPIPDIPDEVSSLN